MTLRARISHESSPLNAGGPLKTTLVFAIDRYFYESNSRSLVRNPSMVDRRIQTFCRFPLAGLDERRRLHPKSIVTESQNHALRNCKAALPHGQWD